MSAMETKSTQVEHGGNSAAGRQSTSEKRNSGDAWEVIAIFCMPDKCTKKKKMTTWRNILSDVQINANHRLKAIYAALA